MDPMTRTIIALSAVLLAAVPQAHANDVQTLGTGYSSCTEYTRFSRTPVRNDFNTWLTGYMTGWNAASIGFSKTYRNLGADSLESMEQWMDAYCTQHPTKTYLDGVIELTNKLPSIV
jgi:hypothetical protein